MARGKDERMPAVVVDVQSITGLQTARLLADRGIPVVGVGNDPSEPFCRSRSLARTVFTSTTDERLIETLVDLGPSLGGKAVLFLSADESVVLVSKHRRRLEPWYHIALPDHRVVETLLDKIAFSRFAEEHGLPIPRTVVLDGPERAREAARSLRYPVVIKPSVKGEGWTEHTKEKAIEVFDERAFLDAYRRVAGWTPGLLAQEWIPGGEDALFSCNAYFGRGGAPLAAFVARKIRQWPPETGRSSLGVSCRNEEVRETTLKLFQLAGFEGPAYLEMKRDERDGRHWIIEPNVGRATGRSAIAEAGGVELLLTQYCDQLGLELPERRVQDDAEVKWIYMRWDLQASVVGLLRGSLTPGAWWRSMRGEKAFAAWSLRDPVPFLLDLVAPLRRRVWRRGG